MLSGASVGVFFPFFLKTHNFELVLDKKENKTRLPQFSTDTLTLFFYPICKASLVSILSWTKSADGCIAYHSYDNFPTVVTYLECKIGTKSFSIWNRWGI